MSILPHTHGEEEVGVGFFHNPHEYCCHANDGAPKMGEEAFLFQ